MSKWAHNDALDNGPKYVADNGDKYHLCVGQPTDYADMVSKSKGNVTLTLGDGNGDYTLGDGDVSGRKLTVAAQTVTPSATTTADHLAIGDSAGATKLLFVTTCNLSLTNGVAKNIAAFDLWEVRDPQ